jgi:hypothetical protein
MLRLVCRALRGLRLSLISHFSADGRGVIPENHVRVDSRREVESVHDPARCSSSSICLEFFVANLFKSRRQLEVENLFIRHQLNIALIISLRTRT